MLIETLLKPRSKPSRKVRHFGVDYDFKPLPGLPDRYVAEVTDQKAIDALIATGAYVEFTDKVPTASLSPAPPAPPATPPAPTPAPPPSEPPPSEPPAPPAPAADSAPEAGSTSTTETTPPADAPAIDAATAEAAKNLLSEAAKGIRNKVANGPTEALPVEVLQAAIALEQKADQPRTSVIDALERALQPKA